MLIDCHMHAFADKIADKAVAQLIDYYKIPTQFGGRLDDVLSASHEAWLDGLILLVAATKPEQVKPANDWVLSLSARYTEQKKEQSPQSSSLEIAHFGAFHPEDPDWETEIQRLRAAGIKGIKLHPEFQGFDLGNPKLGAFFEEIKDDFIVMVHIGDPVVSPDNLSTPQKVAAILDSFPHIRIIAAHLGGYCFWEEACEVLAGREVFLDTSSALCYMDEGLFRKIVNKHGTEKILFGSDYPLRSPKQDMELVYKIKWLTAGDKEKILGENCARLLGL